MKISSGSLNYSTQNEKPKFLNTWIFLLRLNRKSLHLKTMSCTFYCIKRELKIGKMVHTEDSVMFIILLNLGFCSINQTPSNLDQYKQVLNSRKVNNYIIMYRIIWNWSQDTENVFQICPTFKNKGLITGCMEIVTTDGKIMKGDENVKEVKNVWKRRMLLLRHLRKVHLVPQ